MQPEVVSVSEACSMMRLGDTKVRELVTNGDLASVKIGRRRLIRVESIRRLTGADLVAV